MARRRSGLEQVRRGAYFLSRDIGDFQAAQRGLGPLVKRLARRQVRRQVRRKVGRASKGWL